MSENTYTLSPIDCRMLDGISELLNKYKFPENKKYSSKLEARLDVYKRQVWMPI